MKSLRIGQVINNSELTNLFQVRNTSGIRYNKTTNTVALVADFTKGLYPDHWIGDVLYFAGEGQTGDQDIKQRLNARLANSKTSGLEIHLFVVKEAGCYIYTGRATVAGAPHTEIQPDKNGNDRIVWMFPLVSEIPGSVPKIEELTFCSEEDYQKRGKLVIQEFVRRRNNYKGCKLVHYQHGEGVAQGFDAKMGRIAIRFADREIRTYNLDQSLRGGYLKFVA